MYRVEWLDKAKTELTTIYLAASPEDRRAITEAAGAIDAELGTNPHLAGESRSNEDDRIVFSGPIVAKTRLYRDQRMVLVVHVWLPRRRGW